MENSKVIQILRTFSPKEINEFEKFVASPYFSTGRNADGLFNILKNYYPAFDSPELDRELVFKKLFPGEKFNQKKFVNVASALVQLAEQFIVYERFKKDSFEVDLTLSKEYFYRENFKLFYSTISALQKKTDKLPFNRERTFKDKEVISRYEYSYYLKFYQYDKAIPLMGKTAEYSTLYFIIMFIKSLCYKLKAQDLLKSSIENPLVEVVFDGLDLEKIMESLRKRNYEYIWLLELYYYTYRFHSDYDDVDSYYMARKGFNQHKEKYSRFEKHFILEDFLSFCIKRTSMGDSSFTREKFEVCKQIKDENALTVDDNMTYELIKFRNTFYAALKAKEFDWLEEFIKDCVPMLLPQHRKSMKNFSLSRLEFERGNFEDALTFASKIKYDMFIYKLDVKNLLLLIYYELELFDQAESMIDTFKHFIKNNKDYSKEFLARFKDFIDVYTSLFKARSTGKIKDVDLLLKKTEDINALPFRTWFLTKIKEFQK
ncbi:MAG: hypothetical protein KDC42_01530 [Ignavibacteriae bacterium]|nr:hypothetical protein [Ignavibacteriota bacterium]